MEELPANAVIVGNADNRDMAVKPAVKNAFDFIGKSPFFCFHNNKHLTALSSTDYFMFSAIFIIISFSSEEDRRKAPCSVCHVIWFMK